MPAEEQLNTQNIREQQQRSRDLASRFALVTDAFVVSSIVSLHRKKLGASSVHPFQSSNWLLKTEGGKDQDEHKQKQKHQLTKPRKALPVVWPR
jgi:hypothetical protein